MVVYILLKNIPIGLTNNTEIVLQHLKLDTTFQHEHFLCKLGS